MSNSTGVFRPILFGFVGMVAASSAVLADGVADFYKGKQINMTMGTRPGGSFQVYAQVFA